MLPLSRAGDDHASRAAVADSIIGGGGLDTDWVEAGGNVYRLTRKVGIGTSTPEFALTLDGDGGIIAKGTLGAGDTLTTAGAGTRTPWYPRKAAFRAVASTETQWDDGNIGNNSIGLGFNPLADHISSIALGYSPSRPGPLGCDRRVGERERLGGAQRSAPRRTRPSGRWPSATARTPTATVAWLSAMTFRSPAARVWPSAAASMQRTL